MSVQAGIGAPASSVLPTLEPMSQEDIHVRMLKLNLYDAQKKRKYNGKHAKKLLQLVQQGRIAAQKLPTRDKSVKERKFTDRDTSEQGHHPKTVSYTHLTLPTNREV